MGLISDCSAPKQYIVAAALHRNCIVSIVNHRIGDRHIRGCDVEAIGVERETAARTIRVDDRVGDINATATNLHIPPDWLPGLKVMHAAVRRVEIHEVRAASKTSSVDGIRVPPGLAVRVDPAVRHVLATDILDAWALKGEPV